MGQQQLLLIILGTIIVAIAIAIALTLFADNSVSSNRDAIQDDLIHLAARAQHFYRRPKSMGGGSQSYAGLTADSLGMAKLAGSNFSNNDNAVYTIQEAGDANHVVIRAVGKVEMTDGNFPTYDMTVVPGGHTISKVH